ncbi:hypothetical protein [Luteococcus japonicus]|uniref:Uncharacterized protein n=1 Tax=Luteococcus japonicus LSP_Lj1 TaxID=1255658 RepID=A0A1R4K4F8_9ACTN|nr:hypothetical protein [Luteococcus japonicus]SJN39351.1 hypothetical protein FM114_11485 [Luteococcus japonicus LSP_Lj1]
MSITTLRRLASRHGCRLHVVASASKLFPEYGPIYLTDATTGGVIAKGLEYSEVDQALQGLRGDH